MASNIDDATSNRRLGGSNVDLGWRWIAFTIVVLLPLVLYLRVFESWRHQALLVTSWFVGLLSSLRVPGWRLSARVAGAMVGGYGLAVILVPTASSNRRCCGTPGRGMGRRVRGRRGTNGRVGRPGGYGHSIGLSGVVP